MANHIIYDLVYRRDVFDELLAKARRTNIRIAVFAWLLYGILWILRKILQGAFKLINFFQSALSRQMEFHADLVAVSITGSDCSFMHSRSWSSPTPASCRPSATSKTLRNINSTRRTSTTIRPEPPIICVGP